MTSPPGEGLGLEEERWGEWGKGTDRQGGDGREGQTDREGVGGRDRKTGRGWEGGI